MQENMCSYKYGRTWLACICMCWSAWSDVVHVRCHAEILQPSASENPGLYSSHQCYELLCFLTTYHCLLLMKSLSMPLCLLLSLCCVFNVQACINVSHSPYRRLIYESYPGLSLLTPEGSTDAESVTRRIPSCHKHYEYSSDNLWPAASQI